MGNKRHELNIFAKSLVRGTDLWLLSGLDTRPYRWALLAWVLGPL